MLASLNDTSEYIQRLWKKLDETVDAMHLLPNQARLMTA
jgi:hypothetical protein